MPLPQQFETPEKITTPETAPTPEKREQPEQRLPDRSERERPTFQTPYQLPQQPQPAVTLNPAAQLHQSVERVLEDNLQDVFQSLPPAKQTHFRQVGEVTTNKITAMLLTARVAVHSILKLIRNWLKIIPGVNRYYLEQEAKIKSDRIMDIYRRQQEG